MPGGSNDDDDEWTLRPDPWEMRDPGGSDCSRDPDTTLAAMAVTAKEMTS